MKLISDEEILGFIGEQESQFIASPSEFADDVLARLRGDALIKGDLLPWNKAEKLVRLRPGEVSLWAGINGHGKSQLLGQVCAWALHKKWLIASMEMKPASTMERMVRQVAGSKNPNEDYVRRFMKWTDERLWIYDQNDTIPPERIIGLVHYSAKVLGIDHIIIDSLMKCGLGNDDYNGQKSFVDKLCWAAKNTGIHVHLVHHMRKGGKELEEPDKFDVRGAGEIVDLVDNLFIVHRNKSKEERLAQGKEVGEEEPDCTLKIAKQRHGEWEGKFKFWFHKESMQYVPQPKDRPMFYALFR